MTEEQFKLLVRDLCSRLKYGVKIRIEIPFLEESDYPICVLSEIDTKKYTINNSSSVLIENVKPYLRPMSSMTAEEDAEYYLLCGTSGYDTDGNQAERIIVWLEERHFDHRHLIEQGLALVATEDMYR